MAIRCFETQYLTIVGAKGAGMNSRGEVQFTEDDRGPADMQQIGLQPLHVYSIVIPAYGLYLSRVLPWRQATITQFLAQAWAPDEQIGCPMYLEMRGTLLEADRGFVDWLRSVGVEPRAVDRNRKSLIATEIHTAKLSAFSCTFGSRSGTRSGPLALPRANLGLKAEGQFRRQYPGLLSMDTICYEAFMDRGQRFVTQAPLPAADWDATSLPLASSERISAALPPFDSSDPYAWPPRGLRELLEQWPGSRRKLLGECGLPALVVDEWLRERAQLPGPEKHALFDKLGITPSEHGDGYQLSGGYLLIAKSSKAACSLYDELSHGGDLRFSYELHGPNGDQSSMRVLVFANWGDLANVMLFNRDGKAEQALERERLINLGPPLRAPASVWADVQKMVDLQDQGFRARALTFGYKGFPVNSTPFVPEMRLRAKVRTARLQTVIDAAKSKVRTLMKDAREGLNR